MRRVLRPDSDPGSSPRGRGGLTTAAAATPESGGACAARNPLPPAAAQGARELFLATDDPALAGRLELLLNVTVRTAAGSGALATGCRPPPRVPDPPTLESSRC